MEDINGVIYSFNHYCDLYEGGQFDKWTKYPSSKDWRFTANIGLGPGDHLVSNPFHSTETSKWNPIYAQNSLEGFDASTNIFGVPNVANYRQGLRIRSYDYFSPEGVESSIEEQTSEDWDNPEMIIRWNSSYYWSAGGSSNAQFDNSHASEWTIEDVVQLWAVSVYNDGSESLPVHRFRT